MRSRGVGSFVLVVSPTRVCTGACGYVCPYVTGQCFEERVWWCYFRELLLVYVLKVSELCISWFVVSCRIIRKCESLVRATLVCVMVPVEMKELTRTRGSNVEDYVTVVVGCRLRRCWDCVECMACFVMSASVKTQSVIENLIGLQNIYFFVGSEKKQPSIT